MQQSGSVEPHSNLSLNLDKLFSSSALFRRKGSQRQATLFCGDPSSPNFASPLFLKMPRDPWCFGLSAGHEEKDGDIESGQGR